MKRTRTIGGLRMPGARRFKVTVLGYCPKCGRDMPSDYCMSCGGEFPDAVQIDDRRPPRKVGKLKGRKR